MNEVILMESLTLREKLCTDEHTSILERVGDLITLPQEGFATTEQVAHQVYPNSCDQTQRRIRK